MTSKFQATIPAPVRKELGLKTGDAVAFEIVPGHSVTLRKAGLLDLDFARAVEDTLAFEWRTKTPMVTFEAGDVVVVPFPFTDKKTAKRRPAPVLSNVNHFNAGHLVLAMITSHGHTGWPLDVAIQEGHAAGLSTPSVVRMKLFTLDNRLILRKVGAVANKDAKAVAVSLKKLLGKGL